MALPPPGPAAAVPIIVGVGDVRNKSLRIEDAHDPVSLMSQAVRAALQDTGLDAQRQRDVLLSRLDSVSVVPPWTWTYDDLPGRVAAAIGVSSREQLTHKFLGAHGGNQPGLQCDEAARAIAARKSTVAVITGGEALASLAACQKAGKLPPPNWPEPDPSTRHIDLSDVSAIGQNAGTLHSIGLPIHVYPLYENGYRAHNGQTFEQNAQESATMYAAFDEVAVKNPYAWNQGRPPKSAKEIGTVTRKNRLICSPYPLLMNAFNTVNLAAACILTSTEYAEKVGIPREKWIYVLGGAGTQDQAEFWQRRDYTSSPAINNSIDAALSVSGVTEADIDVYDLYSCFPIVPKLACQHLKLSPTSPAKPITLLGGLTSFGGAGNNYSMHALTAMARDLRSGKYQTGLVLANGGVLTYQHVVCLSREPRKDGRDYPSSRPLPEFVHNAPAPAFDEKAAGPAKIETYTVEFDRQGAPKWGHIVGRLTGSQHRFIANHADESTLLELAKPSSEVIGRSGVVKTGTDGRNLFSLQQRGRL
ncbi:thiolase [Xylariales sp. PMI_506]|nr:thiolase [Xylariales sp. PMI_506]